MSNTKEKLKQIKEAIQVSSKPQFELDRVTDELLFWLSQFKFPPYPNAHSWEECIEIFSDPEENFIKPTEGIKLRLVLKLYTTEHTYIISIIECFAPDAVGVGILSVHVNIDHLEYSLQKTIELTYKHSFSDTLSAKQTLYVESFTTETFLESLTNAGIIILGNELRGENKKSDLPILKKTTPTICNFPESE